MTREEREAAIAYIKGYRKLDEDLHNTAPKDSISYYATDKCLKYWDMAIKALEQNERAEEWYKLFVEKFESCEDAISREAAINIASLHCLTIDESVEALKQLPSVQPSRKGHWIPLISRPMTDEEKEYYSEQLDYCDGDAVIYNCQLPEEGQEVLITTYRGDVLVDTFFNDYDGCGFEGYDIEDVAAWMPLPEPYKEEKNDRC